MPVAEIITIGTEILLGEIVDTNAFTIARLLRQSGIDLYRKTTVGDNVGRIAQAIRQALDRAEIIITTGGLGPTVDDPTREAIAAALGVETEFRPELWEQIQARFLRYGRQTTDNNKRQAFIPKGSIPIENPVGTAPSFLWDNPSYVILSLPGVPREMEYLMHSAVLPFLKKRFNLVGTIKSRLVHTAAIGESQIDDWIGDLEQLSNPTVGLAAHSGQVDIRITAKANSEAEADQMIATVENQIFQRLEHWIYGVDEETLEGVVLQALAIKDWKLAVIEASTGGEITRRLASIPGPFLGGQVHTTSPGQNELESLTRSHMLANKANVGLGVSIHPGPEKQDVYLVLISPSGVQRYLRPYGGPPEYAPRWAANHGLDLIRRL